MAEEMNQVEQQQPQAQPQHDVDGLVAKNRELLAELKKYKDKDQAQELERQRKHGEWEKLYKSAEDRAKSLEQELQNERNSVRQERLNAKAVNIAAELAASAASAKLLSRFVQESLQNIADEKGNIKDSALEALKREIKNNSDFAPLVAGSKASGGGASGSVGSANGKRQISMAEYERMSDRDKLHYSKQVRSGEASAPY